jgi:hypothetical protein
MRENRTYGSEGGEGHTLPDPYRHASRRPQRLVSRASHPVSFCSPWHLWPSGSSGRPLAVKIDRCILPLSIVERGSDFAIALEI